MTGVYEAIEPYDMGTLVVADGNHIYWEVCGNPAGKPAIVLHGGPGSGCASALRRYFDPAAYRVVLFDQRGCGLLPVAARSRARRPRGSGSRLVPVGGCACCRATESSARLPI